MYRRQTILSNARESADPANVVRRRTERRALTTAELNAWMQRRIAYFGKPCLTTQEYRAVVYSLLGLPVVAFDDTKMNYDFTIDRPTQDYIAGKMGISQGRVSQLLKNAAQAMQWFELHGRASEVQWERDGKDWSFVAPVMDTPQRERHATVRIVQDRVSRSYKLRFAGDL